MRKESAELMSAILKMESARKIANDMLNAQYPNLYRDKPLTDVLIDVITERINNAKTCTIERVGSDVCPVRIEIDFVPTPEVAAAIDFFDSRGYAIEKNDFNVDGLKLHFAKLEQLRGGNSYSLMLELYRDDAMSLILNKKLKVTNVDMELEQRQTTIMKITEEMNFLKQVWE